MALPSQTLIKEMAVDFNDTFNPQRCHGNVHLPLLAVPAANKTCEETTHLSWIIVVTTASVDVQPFPLLFHPPDPEKNENVNPDSSLKVCSCVC